MNVNFWPYVFSSSVRAWGQKFICDIIEIKHFCSSRETTKKGKGQPTEWEKSCANHTSDKGLHLEYIRINYSSIIKRQPN